jgi:hypothetical protein
VPAEAAGGGRRCPAAPIGRRKAGDQGRAAGSVPAEAAGGSRRCPAAPIGRRKAGAPALPEEAPALRQGRRRDLLQSPRMALMEAALPSESLEERKEADSDQEAIQELLL